MKYFRMAIRKAVSILFLILLLGYNRTKAFDEFQQEDLRVSKNSLQGSINYGTLSDIRAQPGKASDLINNHIGKPVVPSTLSREQGGAGIQARLQGRKHPLADQKLPPSTIAQLNQSSANLFRKLTPYGVCKWMSLNEFKNISLDTNEIIIRDVEERPCYILSIRAHLKFREDIYFPFNNLKSLPHANKIVFESPSDGASIRLPLNCSFMTTNDLGGATGLHLPVYKPNQRFREDITILADCGYLILQLHCDGSFLSLESVSFYQNADIPNQTPTDKSSKESLRTAPQLRSELLVFTTEGTSNHSLFKMPITSRYICQNRLELTGNNNVTLIMDRFELFRMSYPVQKNNLTISRLEMKNGNDTNRDRIYPQMNQNVTQTHVNRLIMDTHCPRPDPKSPSNPVTSMMNLNEALGNNYTSAKSVARHWEPLKGAATRRNEMATTILAKLTYVCGPYLLGHIFGRLLKVSQFSY